VRNGLTIPFIDPGREVPGLRGIHFGTIHASKAFNDANPNVTLAFARAIVRAVQLIAGDGNAAREATRPFFAALDAETYRAAWDAIYPVMPRDPELTPEGVQKELDFEKLVLPAEDSFPIPFSELVDNSWMQKAKQALRR
jgi:ABC-type nitrate/sulfonate/bicarbonate transport system substrate-binding protein